MDNHLLSLYMHNLHIDLCTVAYYEQPNEERSGEYRPEFSSIGYIINGKCRFTVDGVSIYAHSGDFYVLPAHTLQSFHLYDTGAPHRKYYCHFYAPAGGRDLFERLDIPLCISLTSPQRAEAVGILDELCSLNGAPDLLAPLRVKTLLLQLAHLYLSLTEPVRLKGSETSPSLEETLAYMESHLAETLSVRDLAARLYLSESHFIRVFKELTGLPPGQYLLRRRLQRACELLWQTGLPISEIAREVGFADPLYFSKAFKKIYGISPTAMRG